jgi:diguanylate cyclase (GGDEF)-like protein/PAS domain S-box-containing protein
MFFARTGSEGSIGMTSNSDDASTPADGGLDGFAPSLEHDTKYRSLVEHLPAVVYLDPLIEGSGSIYVSPQVQELLGVTQQEWLDDPDCWRKHVHPEDRNRIWRERRRVHTENVELNLDYRMVHDNGDVKWVSEHLFRVCDDHGEPWIVQGVLFDETDKKKAKERIDFLAYHDHMTGLPNRTLFEEMLEKAISRARRHDLAVGVLYLDMDNFKLVNDSLGHEAGDLLLKLLADRLLDCTRETDLVARQSGDEFLLLISDLDRGVDRDGEDLAMAVVDSVAQRVHESLQAPFVLNDTEFIASGSVGISLFPQDALDVHGMLKNADSAMYQSKRFGPGGSVVYASGVADPMEKLSLTTRLRKAVEQEHWVLHYQPVVDLSDGRVVGVESLVRWLEPKGGIVAPGEFIPLAEELGLIEAIGDWVIDEMAKQQKAWTADGLDLEVSFNLSPRQLWSSHLAEKILSKLRESDVDPKKVIVEITESTAMADPDRTQKILSDLHAWGLTLAIDDFGTGYSSLARLKHMPVDILKIDQGFVRNVDKDLGLAGMVRAMIQLAQSLDMVPLAEGIETNGEFVFLRANGCRMAQGFHFSHPVPAEEIPALVRREGGLIPKDASLLL